MAKPNEQVKQPAPFQEVIVHRKEQKKRSSDGVMTSTFKVLEIRRPKVKIKADEAFVLNVGPLDDSRNSLFSLYLRNVKPNEDLPLYVHSHLNNEGEVVSGNFVKDMYDGELTGELSA